MTVEPNNKTQEELLQAAEEAYLAQQQTADDLPPAEDELPVQDPPADETENENENENGNEAEAAPEAEPQPAGPRHTTATAWGIALGLLAGVCIGFLCGAVAPCLVLGLLAGTLLGLWLDSRADAPKAPPKAQVIDHSIVAEEDAEPAPRASEEQEEERPHA